jgi:phosphoribosylpyrophosphate synthetase
MSLDAFGEEVVMTEVLRIVSGSANPGLASAVANHLGVESDGCNLARYPDGELRPTVEDVCGADVYVVQPTAPPVNEHLVEFLGRVLVTDTVTPKEAPTVIEVCSIASTLAMAIACMHDDKPVTPITGLATVIGRRPSKLFRRGLGRSGS